MGMTLYDLFSIGQHRTRKNIAQYDQYTLQSLTRIP